MLCSDSCQVCSGCEVVLQQKRRRLAEPDDATQPACGMMIGAAISQVAYETEPTDSPLPQLM
jgi:hypothetical protein